MMQPITFFVPGIPRPAGSKRGFVVKGCAIITDANPKSRDWKHDVQRHAQGIAEQMQGNLLRCPIKLTVRFILPRPKSHYRTGKNAHLLRDDAPTWHTVKPDSTKLLRGTEDALTGIVWADDAIICDQRATKSYGDTPGCWITISEPSE